MAPEAFVGNQGTRKGDQGLKLVLSRYTLSQLSLSRNLSECARAIRT
jgi:hypothetical protein